MLLNASRVYGCVLGSSRLAQVHTLTVSLSLPCLPLALGSFVMLFWNDKHINNEQICTALRKAVSS